MGRPTVPWHKNDKLFREQLQIGRGYEAYVAGLFIDEGFGVKVPSQKIRPTVEERAAYRDKRDMYVQCPDGFVAEIEVKSANLAFTGPHDNPYPNTIVDGVDIIEAKKPPFAFVRVSQRTPGGMIVVPGKTKEHWRVRKVKDSVRGHDNEFYECPVKHAVTFQELVFWMKRKGDSHEQKGRD